MARPTHAMVKHSPRLGRPFGAQPDQAPEDFPFASLSVPARVPVVVPVVVPSELLAA